MTAASMTLVLLAGVLLLSGAAKLRHPQQTRDAFDALRLPGWLPQPWSARALPWGEAALAILLLVSSGWLLLATSGMVLALMVGYLVVIVRALGFDEPVTCSCFGELGDHTVTRRTAIRNLLLVALAGVAVAVATRGWSLPRALASFGPLDWTWFLVSVVAAALAVLILGRGPATPSDQTAEPAADAADYIASPIPFASLTTLEGREVTLRDLAHTQARLLVWLNLGCPPCERVGATLDRLVQELAPAVGVHAVYTVDLAAARRQPDHALELALIDPEARTSRIFGRLPGPSAVLLGADGTVSGGPVQGERAVMEFFDEVRAALGEPSSPVTT